MALQGVDGASARRALEPVDADVGQLGQGADRQRLTASSLDQKR